MTREMFSELLQRNKELEEQFIRATDSAMQLLEIDKEHQKINGELREENKRLNNIINELEMFLKEGTELATGCGITKEYIYAYENTLDKLQELKGSDKE